MSRPRLISVDDWWLTEAVRLHEERAGRRRDDQTAIAAARAAGGTTSCRLVMRARSLPGAEEIRGDIRRLRRLARHLALMLLAIGLFAGFLAARATISDRQVDILLAATALLLLPTLMLLVWVVLITLGARRGASGSLAGGVLAAALGRLGPKMLASDHAAEVTLAGLHLLRMGFGRWLLSIVAHLFWVAYAVAALATLVVFFSIVQYDLTWGTTLLAEQTVIAQVEALAQLPAALGLIAPAEPGWILAGRDGDLTAEGRALWARFLLAMIGVYGLLPRLVLAVASAVLATAGARRLTLDTALPGYLRLSGALTPMPEPEMRGDVPESAPQKTRVRPRNAAGNPVLVAVENERENGSLDIPGIAADVLGRADDRSARQRVLSALAALQRPPPALIAVCSMLRTPDAGTERFIERAADAAGTIPLLVLDQGAQFVGRGGCARARVADWQLLAGRLGAELVVLDLDQPDAGSIARLRELIEGNRQ